jgi:membrane fusion protein, multidrug efflux system
MRLIRRIFSLSALRQVCPVGQDRASSFDGSHHVRTREWRIMSKRNLAVSFAVLLVGCGLFGWRQIKGAAPPANLPPPTSVSATKVEARNVANTLRGIGALQAVQGVTLAPEQSGRVIAIYFQAGQTVKAGTPLVRLFDEPERAGLADAKAKAEFARIQLERSTSLQPTGAEARQVLQQRQSELAQAEAAVARYNAQIAQKSIAAPFDGEIGIRRINLGQFVNAGDPIATLTSLDPLYVNFTLPQQDLRLLHVGAAIEVNSDAYPDRHFHARIATIEPQIGGDTRNVTVQATLSNTDHTLRPGMYVMAGVDLPESPALLVPLTAIQTSASGDSVVVVRGAAAERGGKAQFVPVKLGQQVGESVIVQAGLKPGDVVVTRGQLRLRPDAAVKVEPISPATGD